ncbi:MAG: hypothetical protein GKR94_14455 [Gammaproteobacteria bacterium]|nr:hypothetical protein [Gammaproteobacteria bacterium]
MTRWLPAWQPLRQGDLVDVIAPASAACDAALEAGLAVLRSWGLRLRVPADLMRPDPFFANEDTIRWQHLRTALKAQDSSAIWCARGGVGCIRLVPRLSRMARPARAKPLIGFSDISVLLLALDAWRWTPVHGPVLTQLASTHPGLGSGQTKLVRDLLFARMGGLSFPGLRPLNDAARAAQSVRGSLSGGNLTTLQTLCGSPIQLRGRKRIVFFEDVNERGYQIDRMLSAMLNAGAFKGAAAVVFGQFLNDKESGGRGYAPLAMENFAGRVRFPVFAGLKMGHGPYLPPMVLGVPAKIVSSGGKRGAGRWTLRMSLKEVDALEPP